MEKRRKTNVAYLRLSLVMILNFVILSSVIFFNKYVYYFRAIPLIKQTWKNILYVLEYMYHLL